MRGLIVNSGASAKAAELQPCQAKLSARAALVAARGAVKPDRALGRQGAPAIYQGPWPIRNGVNHQPGMS
jgi:hypothetical protein